MAAHAGQCGHESHQLALQIDRDRNYIRDSFSGRKGSLTARSVKQAAHVLGVSAEYLLGSYADGERDQRGDALAKAWPQTRAIPLFGQGRAGEDRKFLLDHQRLADLPCPPQLDRVAYPYAVIIYGNSMEPCYRSGEIVYANPARSPRREDDVIIQVTDATGRIWA